MPHSSIIKTALCLSPSAQLPFVILALIFFYACGFISWTKISLPYLLVLLEPVFIELALLVVPWLWRHTSKRPRKDSLLAHYCLLACCAACIIAAVVWNESLVSDDVQHLIMLLLPSTAVVVDLLVCIIYVSLGFQVVDRFLVLPNQAIITHHYIRVLADGRVRREIGRREAGVRKIKTASCIFLMYSLITVIVAGMLEDAFPGKGPIIAGFAHIMVPFLRCWQWRRNPEALEKLLIPIERPRALVFDPVFEFVIVGGEEVVDQVDGHESHTSNCFESVRRGGVVDGCGPFHVEAKGVG